MAHNNSKIIEKAKRYMRHDADADIYGRAANGGGIKSLTDKGVKIMDNLEEIGTLVAGMSGQNAELMDRILYIINETRKQLLTGEEYAKVNDDIGNMNGIVMRWVA